MGGTLGGTFHNNAVWIDYFTATVTSKSGSRPPASCFVDLDEEVVRELGVKVAEAFPQEFAEEAGSEDGSSSPLNHCVLVGTGAPAGAAHHDHSHDHSSSPEEVLGLDLGSGLARPERGQQRHPKAHSIPTTLAEAYKIGSPTHVTQPHFTLVFLRMLGLLVAAAAVPVFVFFLFGPGRELAVRLFLLMILDRRGNPWATLIKGGCRCFFKNTKEIGAVEMSGAFSRRKQHA